MSACTRGYQKAQRQQERDAKRRLRELERRSKELAKLSEIEQARLEVETYEGRLGVLLSIHKECGRTWNWKDYAISLPPVKPANLRFNEAKAKPWAELKAGNESELAAELAIAKSQDEKEFQQAMTSFNEEVTEWNRMRSLAMRILAREERAFTESLVEFSGLAELSDLGSSVHFTVHGAELVECTLSVGGQHAIPSEVKSLTASGKLSAKRMPKGQFHEIYQDYVCGCVLRVAREVFAVLPVETIILTASAEMLDSSIGHVRECPVLSVAISRAQLNSLDFENLDPSDSLQNFIHRGDAKASRKSGEFTVISPLSWEDFANGPARDPSIAELFEALRKLTSEIDASLSPHAGKTVSTQPNTNPIP